MSGQLFPAPLPHREPDRCQCGAPLERYGAANGIIGWHLTMAGGTSDVSGVCGACRIEELRGRQNLEVIRR